MDRNWNACIARLLVHEGGYSNHPADPGGPTNFGITLADYRRYGGKPDATAEDVKRMRRDEAVAIYKAKYWNAQRCGELPDGVDDVIFDYGVNSGVGRAGKVLRAVLGLPTNVATITPAVVAEAKKRDAKQLIIAICDERVRFLRSLRTYGVFGKGWERRVDEVRSFALQLAAAAKAGPSPLPQTPVPMPPPSSEVSETGKGKVDVPIVPAPKTSGAAGAGAAVGVWGFWNWIAAHPIESAAIAAMFAVALTVAVHLVRKSIAARQETPMPGTPVIPEAAIVGVRP